MWEPPGVGGGVNGAALVLADAFRPPPAARPRLPVRVPLARAAGRSPDRPRRPPASGRLPGAPDGALRLSSRRLRRLPEHVLARRLGPRARRDRLARRRPVAGRPRRVRERARARRPVGAIPLVRPHRTGLVRLRLGDPADRDRLPRALPLPPPRPPTLSPPAAAGRR